MSERRYTADGLSVRMRGLGRADVRVQIEHESGAAMIVPRAARDGDRLRTTGFDGIQYTFVVDDETGTLCIEASGAAPLLGGAERVTLTRGPDLALDPASLRVTGDEETMPIPTSKP